MVVRLFHPDALAHVSRARRRPMSCRWHEARSLQHPSGLDPLGDAHGDVASTSEHAAAVRRGHREKTRPYLRRKQASRLFTVGPQVRCSAKSSWFFEFENRTKGGPARWSMKVRIRHLLSGRYLAVKYPPSAMHHSQYELGGARSAPHFAPRHDRHGCQFEAVMVDDADGGGTLFSLLPTAETREEDEGCVVLDDCSVRIYHEFATPYGYYPLLETGGVSERGRDIAGCYLAFAGPEHHKRDPRDARARARLPGQTPASFALAFVEHKRGEPRPTPFEVLEVEVAEATSTRMVMNLRAACERYTHVLRRGHAALGAQCRDDTWAALEAVVRFVTLAGFDDASKPIMELHGEPIFAKQELCREGKLIDALFDVVQVRARAVCRARSVARRLPPPPPPSSSPQTRFADVAERARGRPDDGARPRRRDAEARPRHPRDPPARVQGAAPRDPGQPPLRALPPRATS